MIPILSREEMRAFDKHAIEACNVPSLLLMENAGRGATDIIERHLLGGSAVAKLVLVVCGAGNNGGDGFVVARHLLARGAIVDVWLVGDRAKETPDCKVNRAAFEGIGGRVIEDGHGLERMAALSAVVVDAMFGTGLTRALEGELAEAVSHLAAARVAGMGTLIAALDVPSGLDANTGIALGPCVEADLTVTFGHLKLGHMTGSGARHAGPVHVVDIGVPPTLVPGQSAELVEADDVRAILKRRPIDTHKYRAGHVALIAGSPGKTGAALLAAQGALRGGAGAATIVTWPASADVLEARIPEVMVARLDPQRLVASVDELLAKKKACLIGPGLGTTDEARDLSRHVLKTFEGTVVCDADAFSLHAGKPDDFATAKGTPILTPHSGELGRLLGIDSDAVEADRFGAARTAAKKANAVVLLKGAYTVIADPEGRLVVTGSGSPALATAGSGDVLAGLVTALACSLPAYEAAWVGAFLHGVAGSAWQKEHGDRGLLAGEIAGELPGVIAALLAQV